MKNNKNEEMLPEYDFSKGVRGKYYNKYQEGSNVVVLEPEVIKEFPDSKSVNDALKHLIQIIKRHEKIIKSTK